MNSGKSNANFKYPPYPIRSTGLRKIALRAVTQLTLASFNGSPFLWKTSGKKYGKNLPSVYLTPLISEIKRSVVPEPTDPTAASNPMDSKYFPHEEINTQLGIESTFSDDEINNILKTNYSTRYSFLILSLLYPGRDWKDKRYNEDHIFPQSEFTKAKLSKRGYDDEKITLYQNYYNTIYNLELLDDSENKSKNASPFDLWITSRDANFKQRHFIPELENYDFDHFIEFVEARKVLLSEKFKGVKFIDFIDN